jgi:RNA polymerase sigma-70 factor, ECF subfamily
VINAARQDPPDPCRSQERRPALTLVPPLPADPAKASEESSRRAGLSGADTARPATADGEAIAKLWHRHGDALLRFALKLTRGDRHRAEDIVQETLLRAWRHPEVVGSGDRAIRAWLFTVTRHVAIDMWRARSRADETIDDWHTDRPDPAEPIEQVVTALEVQAAIAQLTPQQRDVVVGMYFHGRSTAELAQSLRIPVGTVKSRAHYGLRRLRELLSPEPARPATPVVPASPWCRATAYAAAPYDRPSRASAGSRPEPDLSWQSARRPAVSAGLAPPVRWVTRPATLR